jgi:hypothetical protein
LKSFLGFEQFVKIFGEITILHVLEIVLSVIFLVLVYRKIRDYLTEVHKAHMKKDEQLKTALEVVEKFPEIQKKIERDISDLKQSQENTMNKIVELDNRITEREQDKSRDRLLQHYRYYTNKETNPSLSWTKREADSFWALFKQFEKDGGDGFMHTDVQPEMQKLKITNN